MLLHTSYVWNDGGEKIRIEAEEFVSLDQAQLAAKRLVISPEFAGTLTIRFPLRNWPPPHRYALEKMQKLQGEAATNQWAIWYPGQLDLTTMDVERSSHGVLMSLGATTPGNGPRVGEAIAIDWTAVSEVETHKAAKSAEAQLRLNVRPGESYSFTKFACVMTKPTIAVAAAAPGGAPRGNLSRETGTTLHQMQIPDRGAEWLRKE